MKKMYIILATVLFVIIKTASAQVVINEVYGGGGNSGATYTNDFIELYNNGISAVDLTGWSLQYTSSTGTAWTVTPLTGSIPPHGYYLIQEAAGAGGTTALPTPDATGTIAMAAAAGKVILCNVVTAQTVANPTGAQIIDKVGYGTGVNGFEGTGPTPAPSAINSVQRTPVGTDTDNNNADFTAGLPSPSNSSTGIGTNVTVTSGLNAAEPATDGTFIITLTSPAPAGGVTINYTLTGTATINSDYTDAQNGTVIIPQGQTSATLTLTTINDAAPEPDETIIITLTSATPPYIITAASAAITLFSDDITPVSLTGIIYTQNFNSWVSSGTGSLYTLLPLGWAFSETGTAANTSYSAGTGSSTSGDTYSFGATANTERAFGTLQSGSVVPVIGSLFTNNTSSTITSLKISYTGEEWRLGAATRTDQLDFQYSLDATNLTNGTWTDVNQLDFITPNTTTTGSLDGNIAANQTAITYTITGLSIPVGVSFFIRWNDFNVSGADDGLAVDDFSIETNPADNTAPVISSISPLNNAVNVPVNLTTTITFSENIQKGTGNIFVKKFADNTIVQTIDITTTAVTVSNNTASFSITGLTENTAYYIEIDNGAFKDLANNNFAGISGNGMWKFTTGSIFYYASFNTCASSPTEGFTQYSALGAQVWACTTFGRDASNLPSGSAPNGVQINGFNVTNVPNEDWLISPAFNLTSTTYPLLSFWSRTRFNGAPLQLKVSIDYPGTGDPRNYTWTDINGRFAGQTTDIWTLSSNINFSAFKATNVHFAFVYFSSADDGARWTLDDIQLDNSATPPPPSLDVSTNDIQFGYAASGSTLVKTFTVNGNDITGNIQLNSTNNFSLSSDSITFNSSLTLLQADANNVTKKIYVRFEPDVNSKNFQGSVIINTASVTPDTLTLKGTSIDPAKTLEMVNWNLEWFGSTDPTLGPTNDALQEQNVKTVLQTVGADIYGLVEVVDTARLGNIVRQMPGYDFIVCNYGSHVNPPDPAGGPLSGAQKEAFVYKTSMFSNITTRALINNQDVSSTSYNSWASGRYPFMMTADVTLAGVTKTINFILIHAKANTSPTVTSYNRRKAAADELHDTLTTFFATNNIIILGDFNDDLDSTITDGITPRITSYSSFTNDSINFFSPTLALSLAHKKSTVGFNEVIDHVMVSNELKGFYMNSSSNILTDVAALIPNYGTTTTDHYPVFTRFAFDAALPVHLLNFNAVKQNTIVKLEWKTSEEINSKEFAVLRSADGVIFNTIGTVNAKGFASDYSLVDANPAIGNNFYKLQMTDKDGKFEYSKIVKVNFNKQMLVHITPNPASTIINIAIENINSAITVQVIDLNGKLVKQQLISQGSRSGSINITGLAKGFYTVKVITTSSAGTQKLLIQ
jgi:Bacterial Ig-like domain/Lamin Tail Domain/Secretion system C-terminal sorting domain